MKFIHGQEGFLINQEVNRAIRKLQLEPIYYSEGEPLLDISFDALTPSMFGGKKLIVVKNHPAFSKKDPQTKEFVESIRGIQEVELIFVLETEKLDKKNEIVKMLLDVAEVKEYKLISQRDMAPTIKKIITSKDGVIDNASVLKLAEILPTDIRLMVHEIDKLLLESKIIDLKMIETSIGDYLKEDYFALSNALTSLDAKGIIEAYNKKKIAGEDAPTIISQLSSVLLLALSVYAYKKMGLTNSDISDKTKIHIFRIKKAAELLNTSNEFDIKEIIKSLAQLDADIKMGLVDPNHGMDIYLLKLIR